MRKVPPNSRLGLKSAHLNSRLGLVDNSPPRLTIHSRNQYQNSQEQIARPPVVEVRL